MPAPTPEAEEPCEDLGAILEAAAVHAREGDYDGVFIIFRTRRESPEAGGDIDVMYSTTTDPEKLWMLEGAKTWLTAAAYEED